MIAEDPDNLMKLTAERFEAFLLVFEVSVRSSSHER